MPRRQYGLLSRRESGKPAGKHRENVGGEDRGALHLQVKRTSVQAPWQNGTAERWVGSCRREVFDHVIALDERHLRRLVREYVAYYHEDRIHDALAKDTPNRRCVECRPSGEAQVASSARLGGLHHRYSWRLAA